MLGQIELVEKLVDPQESLPRDANPAVAQCVDRHVRALGWPSNAKMDFFTTTY